MKINLKDMSKELRLLVLAVLIFVCELLFIYSANWIGYHYFHWGTSEFNANLNYVVRVFASGITPVSFFVEQ